MTKKRKQRLRQRQWNIASHQHEDYLRHTVDSDESKANHKKYLSEIASDVDELRSRTVFVSQVKDLKEEINSQNLKLFLESKYGPVEKLLVTNDGNRGSGRGIKRRKYGQQFPRARVRFTSAVHAQKIFGGRSLLVLDPKTTSVDVQCDSAGHRGFLKIQPSESHPSLYLDDISTSTTIEFTADNVSVGHWIPARKDSYVQLMGDGVTETSQDSQSDVLKELGEMDKFEWKKDEWLEEGQVGKCKVVFALGLRQMEIQIEKEELVVAYLVVDFKWMHTHMDICRGSSNRVSLAFALTQCPLLMDSERDRVLRYGSIQSKTFARCRGIRLLVDDSVLAQLQLTPERVSEFKQFGLVSRSVLKFEPDVEIAIRSIFENGQIEASLQSIPDRVVGK
jgi:hypothetical protein